jgi:ferredoxin--NADP+ reductase
VIGTNKKDAADTVKRILEDRAAGVLDEPAEPDAHSLADVFSRSAPAVT